MGLLDLPAPLLTWLDGCLGFLPGGIRLILWGAIAGVGSMLLYAVLSPQERIAQGKAEQRNARRRLDEFDGELDEALPLIRELLGAALGQVGRVLGPAVAASVPVLCVMVWLSNAYGYRYPDAGDAVAVAVSPAELFARWDASRGVTPHIEVTTPTRQALLSVPVEAPVPVLEKRHWWNLVIGNPAGYLPADGPVDRLSPTLPRRQLVGFGPEWARGWELTFLLSTVIASLLIKSLRRIH